MGLTRGVKSHRLSGQISPYCEKKRHWLCAYCAPMFDRACNIFTIMNFFVHNFVKLSDGYNVSYIGAVSEITFI